MRHQLLLLCCCHRDSRDNKVVNVLIKESSNRKQALNRNKYWNQTTISLFFFFKFPSMAYLDLNPHVVGIYLVHRLTSNDSMSNLGISHNPKITARTSFKTADFCLQSHLGISPFRCEHVR